MTKRPLPKYVHEDRDRHGNVRRYFWRRPGPKVRMHEEPGSPEFWHRYAELMRLSSLGAIERKPKRGEPPPHKTLGWVAEQWMHSREFTRLGKQTQKDRRWYVDAMLAEPINRTLPGVTFAKMPIERVTKEAVEVLRDRKADTPTSANTRVFLMRQLLRWAVKQGYVPTNAAEQVENLPYKSDGHRTWLIEELQQYRDRWPIGTKQRLAFEILYWTGCRISDLAQLGRQHVRGGRIIFTAHKNRERSPARIDIPAAPELLDIIANSPCGELTFLTTEWGPPYKSHKGLSRRFVDWCREAGLPKGCSGHGIRKAAACELALKGANVNQLMAVFGWKTAKEALRYTEAAERARLSDHAFILRSRTEPGTICSHTTPSSNVLTLPSAKNTRKNNDL
jgi:integrase